jgi:arylsulfatase A-like enzyme
VAHRHFDGVYFGDTPDPVRTTGFEGNYQTDLAIEFLRRQTSQPFFLYLSWVAPHSPFTPPHQYDTYDPRRLRLRPNVPPASEAATRKNLAGYYGLCAAVDANLGRLLAQLKALGLARDTIVVFTSDHGEMLGSHGIDAIDLPYEESTRIPLVIRYPGRIRAGSEEKTLISNVDFAPTLLSLCGAAIPRGVQGVDHSGALTGSRGRVPDSIFAEGALGQKDEWRMIVRGRYKLVAAADMSATHLFDVGSDPYELNDLVAQESKRDLRRRLIEELRDWARRTERSG